MSALTPKDWSALLHMHQEQNKANLQALRGPNFTQVFTLFGVILLVLERFA